MGTALSRVNLDELTIEELTSIRDTVDAVIVKKKAQSSLKSNASDKNINKVDNKAPPPPPVVEKEIIKKHENKSMAPNSDYNHDRKGLMGGLAALGLVEEKKVDKKILLSNKSGYPLIFIVSSDPHAQQLNKGNLALGHSGIDGGVGLQRKEILNQIITLNNGKESEVLCRTNHAYVTVARLKSDKRYAVYRYRREVAFGITYTVSEDMVAGDDTDIRPATFLEEFK